MIDKIALGTLTPAERARVIYSTAQSELASRLWKAALGDSEGGDRVNGADLANNPSSLDSLLATMTPKEGGSGGDSALAALTKCICDGEEPAAPALPASGTSAAGIAAPIPPTDAVPEQATATIDGLGPNTRYRDSLCAAARQTGIPATALASIIDAEAAKRRDGSWNPSSRNPRSSAAGLGQFLSRTWEGLAERPGTWLHAVASTNGWLNDRGKVRGDARGSLLALRYDPNASIRGIADFARQNLDRLESKGVKTNDNVRTIARAAYLSHHLGFGDAMKFLKGGIQPERARALLHAQVGGVDAERRIASAGDPSRAHQQWLLSYIDRRIQPERFAI
ncbi:MAG: peptidoglycan-binding protein [Pseudomonadota bacterium]